MYFLNSVLSRRASESAHEWRARHPAPRFLSRDKRGVDWHKLLFLNKASLKKMQDTTVDIGTHAVFDKRSKAVAVFFLMLVVVSFLVVSSVIIFRSDESCRVPMHLGPVAGDLCNSHACDVRVEDIRFKFGNCCDRSTLEYCFLDVKERPFYERVIRSCVCRGSSCRVNEFSLWRCICTATDFKLATGGVL